MPRLVVEEDGERRELALTEDTVIVGRDLANAVVIRDTMSSRRHCQIRPDEGRYVLEDLKSSNGTLLNGVNTPEAGLGDGDVIQVGQVRITYVADGSDAPAPNGTGEMLSVESADESVDEIVPTLHVLDGPASGAEVEIDEVPYSLGRRKDCDLVLLDRRISSQHAEVRREGGEWILVDLDSGNGTFVGKRRIKRHVLLEGQEITVGDTKIKFTGLPEVATKIAERPLAKAAQPIRVADQFSSEFAEASRRVDVGEVGQSSGPWQAIFTAVFFLSFLVILYFGYSMVTDYIQSVRPPEVTGNLLTNANWSFEDVSESGVVAGWSAAPEGDGGDIQALVEGAPHGRTALAFASSGAPKKGFVRAQSDYIVDVSMSDVLELSGKLRHDGFRVAGLEVVWLKRTDTGFQIVDTSVTQLIRSKATFANLKSRVTPPSTANVEACRVALIGWGGGGTLYADELVLTKVDESAAEPVTVALASKVDNDRDLKFSFRDDGSFSVQRGRQLVIRNARAAQYAEGRVPFGQRLSITTEPPTVDAVGTVTSGSSFLDTDGKTAVFQTRTQVLGDAVKVSLQDFSGGNDRSVVLEFDPLVFDQPLSVFKDDAPLKQGVTLDELDGVTADEWVMGERLRQLIVSFSQPLECHVVEASSSITGSKGTVVLVAPLGFRGGGLDIYFSTANRREEARIAEAFRRIEEHRRADKLGEVLGVITRLTEELSWRKDLRARAATLRAEIDTQGTTRVAELRAIRSDVSKFGAAPVRSLFQRRAAEIQAAFAGTEFADQVGRILSESASDVNDRATQNTKREAEDLVKQAESYYNAQQDALSRIYCERTISEFPGTEPARRAREVLNLIEARD